MSDGSNNCKYRHTSASVKKNVAFTRNVHQQTDWQCQYPWSWTVRATGSGDGRMRWLLACSLFAAVVVILCYFVYVQQSDSRLSRQVDIRLESLALFRQYDRDNDGYISLEEFEPLAHLLREENITQTYEYVQDISLADEVLTVRAYFIPLQLSSMTKDLNRSYLNPGQLDPLKGLKEWRFVTKPWRNIAARYFSMFLPPGDHVETGLVWDIVKSSLSSTSTGQLSSNRYFPMRVHSTEVTLHQLLSMFHPQVFLYTRFGPQGSTAIVRAENADYLDVVFRIHAEFQLNAPPYYPLWFTPAQFSGRIVLRRDSSGVILFYLQVPSDRKLNVDMEWLNGQNESENAEVDIGYMPQMELQSTASSVPGSMNIGGQVIDKRFVEVAPTEQSIQLSDIQWQREMSEEQARRILEKKMYHFQKVPYHPLSEALKRAEAERKLVHSIVLWGALDDQSC